MRTGHNIFNVIVFQNKNVGSINFSPRANLLKLIAKLIYRTVKIFNIVCFIWYLRSLTLLEKFLENPGKSLNFTSSYQWQPWTESRDHYVVPTLKHFVT